MSEQSCLLPCKLLIECLLMVCCRAGKDDAADKATNQDASKHLGGREGKKQTMKTNTKQGAAFTTWARSAPPVSEKTSLSC